MMRVHKKEEKKPQTQETGHNSSLRFFVFFFANCLKSLAITIFQSLKRNFNTILSELLTIIIKHIKSHSLNIQG